MLSMGYRVVNHIHVLVIIDKVEIMLGTDLTPMHVVLASYVSDVCRTCDGHHTSQCIESWGTAGGWE